MITLHHLNNSRSQRILWLLEELNIDYEIKPYQRDSETQLAPKSLKKIHPLGKSPVISDGDLTLAESGVIIEYLATTYGPELLIEKSDPAYWDLAYWMHYAEGSLMPNLVMKLVFDKIKEAPLPFFIKPVVNIIHSKVMETFLGPNIQTHMTFLENHLKDNTWFMGETLTIADFQMSFPLEASFDRIKGNYPQVRAYVKRVQDRSAYQVALKAGGPYDYAK